MKVKLIVITITITTLLIIAAGSFYYFYIKNRSAGLYIQTSPASMVFINGQEEGRTPLRIVRKPEEVVVKLVPDSYDLPLSPYETKIKLVSGVETVVRRDFGQTEALSEGEIISFEKSQQGNTGLAVVTTPDKAEVLINNTSKGSSPFTTDDVSEGEYNLKIKSDGFVDRSVGVQIYKGYKLTAIVYLKKAKQSEDDNQESSSPETETGNEKEVSNKETIEITTTPIGYLRVREKPATSADEVGKVNPGQRFEVLEEDKSGWYKIEYAKEKFGWVSDQYTKKVNSVSPTSTPSPKPTK